MPYNIISYHIISYIIITSYNLWCFTIIILEIRNLFFFRKSSDSKNCGSSQLPSDQATSDLALLRRLMQSHPNIIYLFLGINGNSWELMYPMNILNMSLISHYPIVVSTSVRLSCSIPKIVGHLSNLTIDQGNKQIFPPVNVYRTMENHHL